MTVWRGALLACTLSSLGLYTSVGATACNDRFSFDVPLVGNVEGGAQPQAGSTGAAPGGAGVSAGGTGAALGCGEHAACGPNLHCVDGHCHPCAGDGDCMQPGLAHCDAQRHRCVACLTTADCSDGFSCDTFANRCLQACKTLGDCAANAHGCDEKRGVCYQCDEDRECAKSALGALCALDGSGCVHCRSDTDCSGLQHCDPLLGHCVECRDWRDCDAGVCDPIAGVCQAAD